MSENVEFGVIEAVHEVSIAAPRERVWRAITKEAGAWWHKDFYTGAAVDFVIDARVGGCVYEDWGNGQGQVWYTVTAAKENELLMLSGELFPNYGGPARMQNIWTLKDSGGVTTLRLQEFVFGRIGPETKSSLEQGWKILLTDCLKPHVE